MLMDDLKILTEQVERLVIENSLLRKASAEQRELNGVLREEYNELAADECITKKQLTQVFQALNDWNKWFDTWAIMLDGSTYDEAYEYYCASRDATEIIGGKINV